MAKSKIPAVNPRSRAAKRATSPSIDVDKSIKETPRALGTSPMLGLTRNSGVSKKKKAKNMTRGQRARQEKGLARAEAVMDQMEKKVDGAKTRLKTRNSRKALWEDINDASAEEKRKAVRTPGRDTVNETNQDQESDNEAEAGEIEMGGADPRPNGETHSHSALEAEPSNKSGQVPGHALHEDESDLIT